MEIKLDLKAKLNELVDKLKSDPKLLQRFQKEPVKTLEDLVGVDLPDEQLQGLVTGIKAKLGAADAGEMLGQLGKLFGKKDND